MPNWCENSLTLRHADPAMIRRVADGYNNDRLFGEFFPCPEELTETVAGMTATPDSQEYQDHIAKVKANQERFGYSDWYEWQVNEWGTKWDTGSKDSDTVTLDDGATEINLYFNTAWSPPVRWYEKMEELGFEVRAYYYEQGMAFCGQYIDGEDAEFEVPGSSADVAESIPEEIDQAFNISENMAMWEEESQMDDETYSADEEEESK